MSEENAIVSKARTGPRSPEEREYDFARITEWLLEGKTVRWIADELKLSAGTIYNDLKVIHEHWQGKTVFNYDLFIQEQIAVLDRVQQEAWEAFERSKGDQNTLMTTGYSGNKPSTVQKTTRKAPPGDRGWLEVVLSCVDKKIKLTGADRHMLGEQQAGDIDEDAINQLRNKVGKHVKDNFFDKMEKDAIEVGVVQQALDSDDAADD